MMLASSISHLLQEQLLLELPGPAAIFTTPAFIATAVSGVIAAALVSIPKFETVVSWVALSTVIKS
jgi:hypothetical protein